MEVKILKGKVMLKFKTFVNEGKKFKMCLFEGKERYWPIIDGWTQNRTPEYIGNDNGKTFYTIKYLNDKKFFVVNIEIEGNEYMPEAFKGSWYLNAWGQNFKGEFKSETGIKSLLNKAEKLYDKFKSDAMPKIPTIQDWKLVVNDTEISYSRKQKNRTVILSITDIQGFIGDFFSVGSTIGIYNDSIDTRVTEREYYENASRITFKNLISKLNNKYFK